MTDTLEHAAPVQTAPRKFTVTAIEDEKPDGTSHRIQSDYVEEHWLSFLGPTAILFARRVDRLLAHEHKYAVNADRWADQMGVTGNDVLAACHRLVRYGLARWSDRDPMLTISRHWPTLPAAISTPLHRRVLISLPDSEAS